MSSSKWFNMSVYHQIVLFPLSILLYPSLSQSLFVPLSPSLSLSLTLSHFPSLNTCHFLIFEVESTRVRVKVKLESLESLGHFYRKPAAARVDIHSTRHRNVHPPLPTSNHPCPTPSNHPYPPLNSPFLVHTQHVYPESHPSNTATAKKHVRTR